MNENISNGKIILVGEHAVVYGMPAIAIPLKSVKTKTNIKKHESFEINSIFGKTTSNKSIDEHEGIYKIIKTFFKDFNIEDQNVLIEITSTSPIKSGLGSSAAVSNSVLLALSNYYEIELTEKEKFKYVQIGEYVHHKNPSGIDAKTVITNKPIYFRKKRRTKVLDINFNGYIIVASTGIESMTLEAVTYVKNYAKENPSLFKKTLKEFKKETNKAKKALLKNDYNKLKSSMMNTQMLLESIGVSDISLETLINTAINNGASAAKLTGGGIGGCMIALCKNKDLTLKITHALKEAGAKETYIINLGEL